MKTLCLVALVLGAPAAAEEQGEPTTAEQAKASVVQRHINAYRARNLDAFVRTFSSDAVLVYGGMEFHGHDQIRHAYSLNFTPDAPAIEILSSGANGGVVWIETTYRFPSGEELCCGYSEYTVRDGKIVMLVVNGP